MAISKRLAALRHDRRTFQLCCAFVGVLLSAGCGSVHKGPAREAADGMVQVGGAPLKIGVIRFIPVEPTKGPAAAAAIRDGRFRLSRAEGPVVGKQRVEIQAGLEEDPVADAGDAEAARVVYFKEHVPRRPDVLIPAIYNKNSTLEVVVAADLDNTFEFQLNAP